VWGGKITTFRKLAEDAATEVGRMLGDPRKPWTAGAFLPGGELSAWVGPARRPDTDFDRLLLAIAQRHPWLPAPLLRRLARAYGSRVAEPSSSANALADLGTEVAPGLFEAELRFLITEEWALSADDVLWRRSKLGLHYTPSQRQCVHDWMQQQQAPMNQETTMKAMPCS